LAPALLHSGASGQVPPPPVALSDGAPSPGGSSIKVEGSRRIEPDTIRSYFHAGTGGRLDAAALDAGLKALIASGLFQDVRIRRSGELVIVTVAENPVINRLAFEGNGKLKDDQLKTEVQSKAGGTLSRAMVQTDAVRIAELYRRSGYFNATVEPKIIELPRQRVDLVYEIAEQKKTGVKEIDFVGNKAFSSTRLKQIIKSGTTNLLSFILNNDIYDADRVEADRDLIRRFYRNHGYEDIRIISAGANYDAKRKAIVIAFTVDEGPLYRLGKVDVQSSIGSVDAAALRSSVRTATGDVVNAEAIDKTVENLSIELAKRGIPFAVARAQLDRDRNGKIVNVVYNIEEGSRIYVERINIRGNLKTNDNVIRREFDLVEGDPYNRALVDRAERRLKALGFFKTVKITGEPGSAPDRIILDVDVEDQNTGSFSVAGGYGSADGVVVEVSVGERNFLGTGDYVNVATRYGQYTKGIDLGFIDPYILGNRLSLGGDVFYSENSVSSYQSYGSERYGGTITVGTPLTEETGMQWRYSLYRQSVSLAPALLDCSPSNPPAGGCASIPVQQAALIGPQWVSAIGYTLSYNSLDNPRNPTGGFRSDFTQDLAGLGGDVRFLRATEDARYYQDLGGDVVGMVRAQGGYITPWGGQSLPLLDGFFGGPNLVRGFAPNGFGPRDITPGTIQDNVGGTEYWATTAELRTPIPFIPPEAGLRFAAFADAGSLWGYRGVGSTPALAQSLNVADSRTIRSAIGAGLIWDSPFGPLRVDYAFPTSKATYDVTQRLHFGYGAF
jgi:outer membrane protein insertion porin family